MDDIQKDAPLGWRGLMFEPAETYDSTWHWRSPVGVVRWYRTTNDWTAVLYGVSGGGDTYITALNDARAKLMLHRRKISKLLKDTA